MPETSAQQLYCIDEGVLTQWWGLLREKVKWLGIGLWGMVSFKGQAKKKVEESSRGESKVSVVEATKKSGSSWEEGTGFNL